MCVCPQDVIRYSLHNVNTNSLAREHFFVHPDNGNIWLVKSLLDNAVTQISVSFS